MSIKSDIAKVKPRNQSGKFVKKLSMPSAGDNPLVNDHVTANPWIANPSNEFTRAVPPGITPMAPNVWHANTFRMISQTPNQIFRNLDEALRANKISAKAMLNDGAITAPLFQRILHLVSCNDGLVPEDENDPEQIKVCEKLWNIVQKLPDWVEFKRCLAEAIWTGKSANVTDFRWEYDGGDKLMVPHSFTPIMGDKLVFRTNGRMGYIVHTPSGLRDCVVTDIGRAELFNSDDYECITHHKYFIQDMPYDEGMLAIGQEGFGYRHWLYWLWWLKQSVLEWAMTGLQIYGNGGIRIAYFEESNPASEKAVAEAMTAANGSNIILFPRPITDNEKQGPGLEIVSPAGMGLEWFQNFLDGYFGKQINALLLGADWDTERKDFFAYLKFDAQKLSATISRDFIDVLVKYNFPGYPHKIKYEISVPHYNPEMILTASQRLFEMGAPVGAREVASLVGLTVPGAGRRILQKSEQEMMGDQTIKKPIVGGDRDLGDQLSGGTGAEQSREQNANGQDNETIPSGEEANGAGTSGSGLSKTTGL